MSRVVCYLSVKKNKSVKAQQQMVKFSEIIIAILKLKLSFSIVQIGNFVGNELLIISVGINSQLNYNYLFLKKKCLF